MTNSSKPQKNYIIAGSSSGIGLELSKKIIQDGGVVYGLNRSAGPLQSDKNYHHLAHDFSLDSDLPEIGEICNGLIFCPGSIMLKPIERLNSHDIDAAFQLNAKSAFSFVKKYLANIRQSETASILFFSSVAVQVGLPYHVSVSMAKGAIEGLTRALAAELAPKIRVNAVAPSLTDTPLASGLLNSETKIEANKSRHPLQEIGNPTEIASLAYNILTEYHWMTGQILGINGGFGSIIR